MPDILIFDDDPNVASLLAEVLRANGFSVAHYPSADGIMQIVQENRPRLVVLDIMMPGIDGLSACRDIRSNMATRHIKIVVMTAKQFEQDRITAQRYGVSLFINKPFDSAKLGQDIRGLLGFGKDPLAGAAPLPAPPMSVAVFQSSAVVETLDMWVMLDAGRGLGQWVSEHGDLPSLCWMLLSRYEPAVLEDLGACGPLLTAGSVVKLAGPEDADSSLPRLAPKLSAGMFARQAPMVIPQRAKTSPLIYPLREGEFLLAPGAMGQARYTQHPGSALGYSFGLHGRKVVYCPCNEIRPDAAEWNRHELNKFASLFSEADLLMHGYGRSLAQPRRADGIGTGAWEPVVDLAAAAKVKRLLLMPQPGAPIGDILVQAQARISALQSPMRCAVAASGQVVSL
ncbi:MAG: response regulator [Elusimicrobiota bacterium]|jgi:CheY-like chemotaxis protein